MSQAAVVNPPIFMGGFTPSKDGPARITNRLNLRAWTVCRVASARNGL